MSVVLRIAQESDAADIVQLLNPIIKGGRHTIMTENLTLNDQVQFMRQFPAKGVFHVAIDEDNEHDYAAADKHSKRRLIGLQSVEAAPASSCSRAFDHVGEISTFVALDAHRRGVGRLLSVATIDAARRVGFLKLTAPVRADNPQAIAFYQSQGFTIIGIARKHACVHDHFIDEVLMERWIG